MRIGSKLFALSVLAITLILAACGGGSTTPPADTFSLTINLAGAGDGSVTCNGGACATSYEEGTTVTLAAVADAGSVFAGWSGAGCTGTGTCDVTINANTTVTATFDVEAAESHTLVVNVSGAGSVTGDGITCGTDCTEEYDASTTVVLTAAADAGAVFDGWGGACASAGTNATCTVNVTDTTNVTATFKTQYTLSIDFQGVGGGTVSVTPGSNICSDDCDVTVKEGDVVTISATADTNSTFTGWAGGGCEAAGTEACTFTVTGDQTVVANFADQSFALTVTKDGSGAAKGTVTSADGGINCGNICEEFYSVGTSVVLTATAADGAIFDSWGGACAGVIVDTCTVPMNSAKDVSATFLSTFPLTVALNGTGGGIVSSTPAGITCGTDCTEDFLEGTVVTLTAAADSGSSLVSWSEAGCGLSDTCDVTVDAAKTVTATFNTVTKVESQPAASADDAEEFVNDFDTDGNLTADYIAGTVEITSSDLELNYDDAGAGVAQIVGIRFPNLAIPAGATITNAYIQFTAKGGSTGTVSLSVAGHAADNSNQFFPQAGSFGISSRPKTTATATWSPLGWDNNEAGLNQQLRGLEAIVQEIVDRTGWASGNAMTFIITPDAGSNLRRAFSFDGGSAKAPRLIVEFDTP